MIKEFLTCVLLAVLVCLFPASGQASDANFSDTGNPALSTSSPALSNVQFSGNTGVGTSAPQALLAVFAGNVGIGTWTAAGGNLIINGGGNVGISTAWPGTALDVQGTARMTGFQLNNNPTSGYILVSNGVGVGTWMPASTLPLLAGGTPGGASPQLQYDNAGAFGGVVNSAVNSSGNIGIGTTLSANLLDIRGNIGIGTLFAGYRSALANGLIVQGDVGIGTSLVGGGLVVMNGNVGIGTWVPSGPFQVGGSGAPPFLIDANGNVGVGTIFTSFAGLSVMNGNVGVNTLQATNALTVFNSNLSNGGGEDVIDSTGNVGIGTIITTNAKLELAYHQYAFPSIGIGTLNPGTSLEVYASNPLDAPVKVSINSANYASNLNFGYQGAPAMVYGYNGPLATTLNYDEGFYFAADSDEWLLTFLTNNTQRMTVYANSTNNIGIGTVTATNNLDVAGAAAIGSYAGTDIGPTQGLIVSGNVGIGTTTPQSALSVVGDVGIGTWAAANSLAVTGGAGIGFNSFAYTSAPSNGLIVAGNVGIGTTFASQGALIVMNGNVGIGTWKPAYTIQVAGTAGLSSGTAWTNASDIRLKDILGDYQRGLQDVLKLHTVRFKYKANNPLGLPAAKEWTGFIAQEVQQVIPEAVGTGADGYLNINVDPIHWAMVNAIQQLDQYIEESNMALARSVKDLDLKEQEIKLEDRQIDGQLKTLEKKT